MRLKNLWNSILPLMEKSKNKRNLGEAAHFLHSSFLFVLKFAHFSVKCLDEFYTRKE